ncbi:MAG: hypothetical protein LBD66_00450, partial [Holosporales bacterium]|nr:hypothetical protein [Holosporales bacterium]
MIFIVFQSFPSRFSGTLVVGAFEGGVLSVSAKKVDTHLHGALTRALSVQSFSGKTREICTILAPTPDIDRVIVVGLGQENACIARTLEEAGRRFFTQTHAKEAIVLLDPLPSIAQPALAFAEGALLRSWRFTKYRATKPEEPPFRITSLKLAVEDVAAAEQAFASLLQRAQGVFATQDLVSEPANILYPESFALRAQEELAPLGVRVEILDAAQLKKIGMGALLGVAQGSTREPRVVVLEWTGPGAQGVPIAFVGKGLTFDSGGIDLKPQKGMEEMIHDMAGAGVVFGLMKTLALRKAPV